MALDALSGEKDPINLIVSGAIGAGSSLVGAGVGKVVDKIGGKLATKALGNMSKTKLKSIVTGLDTTIKGIERNKIKSMSYLTTNHKDIGLRYFMSTKIGKTISTAMGQIAEGVSGLGADHSIRRCIPSW